MVIIGPLLEWQERPREVASYGWRDRLASAACNWILQPSTKTSSPMRRGVSAVTLAGPMAAMRGQCPSCRYRHPLRKDGAAQAHPVYRGSERRVCEGGGSGSGHTEVA